MQPPAENVQRTTTAQVFVCLTKMLQDASAAIDHDPRAARACVARALMLLGEVRALHDLHGRGSDQTRKLGLARWQLDRVLLHVENHLDESLRIRDLARLSDLSPGHFARAFRRSVGVAPRSFVLERRVERAKKLMRTTDWALSEIALACGLSDQAHLSRIFRRYTGNTPNAWRREWHERGKPDSRVGAVELR